MTAIWKVAPTPATMYLTWTDPSLRRSGPDLLRSMARLQNDVLWVRLCVLSVHTAQTNISVNYAFGSRKEKEAAVDVVLKPRSCQGGLPPHLRFRGGVHQPGWGQCRRPGCGPSQRGTGVSSNYGASLCLDFPREACTPFIYAQSVRDTSKGCRV